MKTDVLGLLGFTLSGLLFVISALRNGDFFSLAGSVVWIISCIGWIGALLTSRAIARRGADQCD